MIFTTHHAGHALTVADDALLMLGETDYAFGPVSDVLTEQRLSGLYEIPVKPFALITTAAGFDTIVPVIPACAQPAS